MPQLNVVPIYESNARQVVEMLRQAADTIESETGEDDRTVAIAAVQLHESGEIQVYGWGETGTVHACGLLAIGMAEVADIQLNGGEE